MVNEFTELDYGWGVGSVLTMLVVVGCVLFLPLGMSSVQPPSTFIFLVFPVLMAAILIFLSHASNPR